MKIVYDLRYARDHFVGIATHGYALLAALLARDDPDQYAVLWDPAFSCHSGDLESLRHHPRVEWVETSVPPARVSAAWPMGRLVRDLAADVYLSPFYLVPRGAGVPSVITLHDVRPLRMAEGFSLRRRLLFRGAMLDAGRAAAVITSSEFSRREILACTSLNPRYVHVVPSGVPPLPAVTPTAPAGGEGRPFALYLGGNRPHKNLALLARIWGSWGPSPPLDLVCAGPEEPRYPLVSELAAAAGTRAMRAIGRVTDAEREWLLRHAVCLVFPTLYEGFGLPVGEAFGRGLPVVASDIPALREVAGDAAILLPPDDAGAWASILTRLAGAPEEGARWRAAGLTRAASLTFTSTADGVLSVVRRAADFSDALQTR